MAGFHIGFFTCSVFVQVLTHACCVLCQSCGSKLCRVGNGLRQPCRQALGSRRWGWYAAEARLPPSESLLAPFAGIMHTARAPRACFLSQSVCLCWFMAEIVRLRVKWAGAGTDCGNRAGCDERQHRTTSTCCWRHGCCHPFLISISCLCKNWSPPHLHEQCSCQSCRHLLHYFDP